MSTNEIKPMKTVTDIYRDVNDVYNNLLTGYKGVTYDDSSYVNTPLYTMQPSINYKTYLTNTVYKSEPTLLPDDEKVGIRMEDGSTSFITREELIKYIGERTLVQQNELVRKMYERYQVAVKLARSDDDGDTGV